MIPPNVSIDNYGRLNDAVDKEILIIDFRYLIIIGNSIVDVGEGREG